MSRAILGRPVPLGAPVYPGPSGETGVCYLAAVGWQRVACFGGPGLEPAWRAVGVGAGAPRTGARSIPCPPRGDVSDAGALLRLRAAVASDLPRRVAAWEDACDDVRGGWDGGEP